ncbi:MAG TPA: tetratricopeptide repeat protein [Bryobacteraceae bacterium]|nr:tetratricopeptide repeat protein [Bryobacteraceae bacterium]
MGRAALRFALFCFAAGLWAQSEEQAGESQHAKELMAAGQYEQAIPIYRKLVQGLPGNTGMVLNLALAEHMAGHDRESIPHFEAVLKAQPNLVPALLSMAQARLALNDPRAAIAPLEKVIAADPKNRDVRGMLAGALLDSERFDQAAAQFRELSTLSPEDPRAWYGLGMSYQGLAGSAFERLEKADPASPFVAALVADTRVQRRQYGSAFALYREALKRLPNLHGIHAALAEVYRKTGHPEWAADEDAREAALPAADCRAHPAECEFLAGHDVPLTAPAHTAAPTAEALFWHAKAANELALQAFFRLGQLPESVEQHRLKAEIARGQGRHLESVQEWRAALALAPRNPRLEREIAVSLFMAADYKSALDEATRLLKIEPRSAELNFVAGDCLVRLEQAEPSLPYLRAALAADPTMLAADASLGLALSRLGKSAEAIPHLQKALELDEDGSLHYQLSSAYRAAGQAEKARAAMTQYQQIVKRNQEQKDEAREAQIGPPGK